MVFRAPQRARGTHGNLYPHSPKMCPLTHAQGVRCSSGQPATSMRGEWCAAPATAARRPTGAAGSWPTTAPGPAPTAAIHPSTTPASHRRFIPPPPTRWAVGCRAYRSTSNRTGSCWYRLPGRHWQGCEPCPIINIIIIIIIIIIRRYTATQPRGAKVRQSHYRVRHWTPQSDQTILQPSPLARSRRMAPRYRPKSASASLNTIRSSLQGRPWGVGHFQTVIKTTNHIGTLHPTRQRPSGLPPVPYLLYLRTTASSLDVMPGTVSALRARRCGRGSYRSSSYGQQKVCDNSSMVSCACRPECIVASVIKKRSNRATPDRHAARHT